MISDMYLDNTELNGDAVRSENIKIYSTVQENNSLVVYPTESNPRKCSIIQSAPITVSIGAMVMTVL